MSEQEFEVERDPELRDDPEEGVGDDSAYDGEAVEYYEYDHSQFELEGEDDDE